MKENALEQNDTERKSLHFLPKEDVTFATSSLSLERSKLRQERKGDDPYMIDFSQSLCYCKHCPLAVFTDPNPHTQKNKAQANQTARALDISRNSSDVSKIQLVLYYQCYVLIG